MKERMEKIRNKLNKKSNTAEDKTNDEEEYKVTGDQLLKKIKEIIAKGQARSIVIKNHKGEPMMEIPVMVTVVGTVLAPYLTALGALAAVVSNCTVVVKKKTPIIK